MITLLRKIRKRLISQSSFTSYLLYAIGEILLVMIGILLALQVNNWNEQRKNKKMEREILMEIREGLSQDLEDAIPRFIRGSQKTVNFTDALIHAIETKTEIPDSLKKDYSRISISFQFYPVITPYKILESKGLDIIQNKDLKSSITKIYNVEYELIQEALENELINKRDIYRPIVRKHFKINPRGSEYRAIPIDYWAMLEDIDFNNTIQVLNGNRNRIKSQFIKLKEKVSKAIEAIDEELNNK